MNLVLVLDNETGDQIETLAPHKNMYDINHPRALSNSASLPKPVVSTISNWIHYKEFDDMDNQKKQWLEALAER